MLTWAVDRGKILANHLRGFKRLYHADRSEIIWLPEHISAFMKVAPQEMQRVDPGIAYWTALHLNKLTPWPAASAPETGPIPNQAHPHPDPPRSEAKAVYGNRTKSLTANV